MAERPRIENDNRMAAASRTPPVRTPEAGGAKGAERGPDIAGERDNVVPKTSGAAKPEGSQPAGATPRPIDKPLGR